MISYGMAFIIALVMFYLGHVEGSAGARRRMQYFGRPPSMVNVKEKYDAMWENYRPPPRKKKA